MFQIDNTKDSQHKATKYETCGQQKSNTKKASEQVWLITHGSYKKMPPTITCESTRMVM
jgi:hypothetical protein